MRRAIPDDREKGLLRAYLFLHEAERFLDDDFGGITLKFLELSLAAHDWIQIEEVGDGQPLLKTKVLGSVWIMRKDRDTWTSQAIEMPFSEVSGRVTGFFESLRESPFLLPQSISVIEDSRAVMGSAREYGCSCGRADRATRIKSVQTEAVVSHFVQVRCL